MVITNRKRSVSNTLIRSALQNHVSISGDQAKAFFKTGRNQYAENDEFLGVTVPSLRKIAQRFANGTFSEIQDLLSSKINEERLLALLILSNQYKKADKEEKERIYQFYLSHLDHVNNWNLVDSSAHLILGAHLWDKKRDYLLHLARSQSIWKRRISIVSTRFFVQKNDLEWTFKIARILLQDREDLIHKAVGWLLREAGKRNQPKLVKFLDEHLEEMHRTTLRYTLEKLPKILQKHYLCIKNKRNTQN